MPRFVVLEHAPGPASRQGLHWDFMLEAGEVLRTWALPHPPDAGILLDAVPLADHRALYLDYEGPLTGDRGHVTRWDQGDCEVIRESPAQLVLRLQGERLRGEAALQQDAADPQRWRFDFTAGGSPTAV